MSGEKQVRQRQQGFTMLEALVALVVGLVILDVAMKEFVDAIKIHHSQSQVATMRQNARNVAEFWSRDLVPTGYGMGFTSGFMPAVSANEPGNLTTFSTTAMTVHYNSLDVWTTLSASMPATSSERKVTTTAGFQTGMRVLIWDDTGTYDWLVITQVQTSPAHLQHNTTNCSKSYDPVDNSMIATIAEISYKWDPATRQVLRQQDGGSWITVATDIQALEFHYFAENGAELFPADTLTRTLIRSVELRMTARTKDKDRVTKLYKTYEIDTSVTPRNLSAS